MRKLFLFLFVFPFFLFASDNNCSCPTGYHYELTENIISDSVSGGGGSYHENDAHPRGCDIPKDSHNLTCSTNWKKYFDVLIDSCDSTIDPDDTPPQKYNWTSMYHTEKKTYECKKCTDPDENLTLLPGQTVAFWALGDDLDNACSAPTLDEESSCTDVNGSFGSETHNCCTRYACIVPLDTNDTNGTDPDTNTTEPPNDCPNGQDVNGHCCSPGETVCQGWCQLNNVPCSDEPDGNGTDPNGGGGGADTNGTDPCDYPLRINDNPYRGHSFDQDECFNDAKLFSDVGCDGNPINAAFEKNDACAWGACYYPNYTHAPDCNDSNGGGGNDNNDSGGGSNNDNNGSTGGDSNSTGDSNSSGGLDLTDTNKKLDQLHKDNIDQTNKLTDKLSELDGSAKDIKNQVKDTGDQLAAVLNALNMAQGDKLNNINDTLKDKLDALNQSIHDKNLSVSVNVENNVSIDLNTTNSLLGDIRSDLNSSLFFNSESWSNSMLSFENAYNNAKTVFDGSMSTFSQSLSDLRGIANGASPSVSYSGSCSLDFTVSFGSFSIDLSSLNDLRPYFAFFLNIVLLFFTIKFYSWIGQYLIRLLVEAI